MFSYRLGPDRGIYGHTAAFEQSLNVTAGIVASFSWSPNIYRGGVRSAAAFAASYWMALTWTNPDDSRYGLEGALEDFEGHAHIIAVHPLPRPESIPRKEPEGYQHYQHDHGWWQAGWERVTIAVPWERPILDEKEYRGNMLAIVAHYGADGICASSDLLLESSEMVVSIETDGALFPVEDVGGKKRRHDLSAYAVKYLTQKTIPDHCLENTVFCLGLEMARAGVSFGVAIERVLCSPTYAKKRGIDTAINEAVQAGFDAVLKRSRKWTM